MSTALYVRVSTQEQAREGYSIGEQTERLRKYAEAMHWPVYKVYTDPGFSGAKLDRPALQAMLKDIRAGWVRRVVVYKLDRLSRSQKDTLTLIEDDFLANGCDFVSMSENFDTATPFGRAMVGVLAVFAQLEREQIRERMMMGKDARAKDGRWNGGLHSPLGYDYTDGRLQVNESEAAIMQEVFRRTAAGDSTYSIVADLTRRGYRSRSGPLDRTSLVRAMRSRVYVGDVPHRDGWTKGLQDPIIDRETFDAVQRVLDRRSDRAFRGYNSCLGGVLRCAHCGAHYAKVTRSNAKNGRTYYYYGCNSRTRKNHQTVKDRNCKNRYWRMEALDQLVFDEIRKLRLEEHRIADTEENRKEAASAEIEKIDAQTERLMDLYSVGGIPLDKLQNKIHELTDRRERLAADSDGEPELPYAEAQKILSTFDDILSGGDLDQIHTVVTSLIDEIEIDGDDITIRWRF